MGSAYQFFRVGHKVSSLTELEGLLIPDPDAMQGWVVYVASSASYYSLSLNSGAAVDPVNVRPTFLGGLSRWLLMNVGDKEKTLLKFSGRIPSVDVYPATFNLSDASEATAAGEGAFPHPAYPLPPQEFSELRADILLEDPINLGAETVSVQLFKAVGPAYAAFVPVGPPIVFTGALNAGYNVRGVSFPAELLADKDLLALRVVQSNSVFGLLEGYLMSVTAS
jgi:hypothetical protein